MNTRGRTWSSCLFRHVYTQEKNKINSYISLDPCFLNPSKWELRGHLSFYHLTNIHSPISSSSNPTTKGMDCFLLFLLAQRKNHHCHSPIILSNFHWIHFSPPNQKMVLTWSKSDHKDSTLPIVCTRWLPLCYVTVGSKKNWT
jgi:hypothetical protein